MFYNRGVQLSRLQYGVVIDKRTGPNSALLGYVWRRVCTLDTTLAVTQFSVAPEKRHSFVL